MTKDARFLHADNGDSDQTVWMRNLICIFVQCTLQRQKQRFLLNNTEQSKEVLVVKIMEVGRFVARVKVPYFATNIRSTKLLLTIKLE